MPRACALQQEKPPQRGPCTARKSSPCSLQLEKSPQQGRLSTTKNKEKNIFFKVEYETSHSNEIIFKVQLKEVAQGNWVTNVFCILTGVTVT